MNQNDITRQEKFILITGTTGTGKTTFCLDLINEKLKTNQNRVLLINPNDEKLANYPNINLDSKEISKFKGIRKAYILDKKDWKNLKNFQNGMLVLDDCRRYIPDNLPIELRDIFINNRHYHIDIITVGHGFTEVPPKFYTFAKQLVLFKTLDSVKLRKKELGSNFEKVEKLIESVAKQYITNKHHKQIISLI